MSERDPMPVLWVEDSETDQMLMRLAAEGTLLDHRLDIASDFETGRALAGAAQRRGEPYRFVMVDMRLGTRNGCEFVDLLRDETAYADSTFAVVTGSTDPADIERITNVGARHIAKPSRFDGWQELVADIIDTARLNDS